MRVFEYWLVSFVSRFPHYHLPCLPWRIGIIGMDWGWYARFARALRACLNTLLRCAGWDGRWRVGDVKD